MPAPPQLFSLREISDFTNYLNSLPAPEKEIDPEKEALPGRQSLIVIPWRKNKLIRRERLSSADDDIQREILPTGGVKVWSRNIVDWSILLAALESSIKECEIVQDDMMMYGIGFSNSGSRVAFHVRVPFGMFDLCREEIEAAFRTNTP